MPSDVMQAQPRPLLQLPDRTHTHACATLTAPDQVQPPCVRFTPSLLVRCIAKCSCGCRRVQADGRASDPGSCTGQPQVAGHHPALLQCLWVRPTRQARWVKLEAEDHVPRVFHCCVPLVRLFYAFLSVMHSSCCCVLLCACAHIQCREARVCLKMDLVLLVLTCTARNHATCTATGEWPRPELRQHSRISGACLDAAMGLIPSLTIKGTQVCLGVG